VIDAIRAEGITIERLGEPLERPDELGRRRGGQRHS